MRRRSRRRLAATAGTAAAIVAIALALSGGARGIALYLYLLLLALVAVVALGRRIRNAWPSTPRFEQLLPPRVEPERRVLQLEGLAGRLDHPNAFDLYERIRPLVRRIVAAQLARGHGVDLDRRPERAEQLVGPRTWQLIRPDLAAPADSWGPTWSARELDELVTELESVS
jgi:hypothetical protein